MKRITEHPYWQCLDCENEGTELHSCPYNAEINEDNSLVCNCCDDCAQECANDI